MASTRSYTCLIAIILSLTLPAGTSTAEVTATSSSAISPSSGPTTVSTSTSEGSSTTDHVTNPTAPAIAPILNPTTVSSSTSEGTSTIAEVTATSSSAISPSSSPTTVSSFTTEGTSTTAEITATSSSATSPSSSPTTVSTSTSERTSTTGQVTNPTASATSPISKPTTSTSEGTSTNDPSTDTTGSGTSPWSSPSTSTPFPASTTPTSTPTPANTTPISTSTTASSSMSTSSPTPTTMTSTVSPTPTTTSTTTPVVTTSTTTSTTTQKPIQCENGGTPSEDNRSCLCPPLFTGRTCAVINSVISPETLKRTVQTTIEVKKIFIPQYADKTSNEYETFSKTFKDEMTAIYANKMKNFKEVVNITLKAATGGASRTRRTLFSGIFVKDPTSKKVSASHDIVVEVPNDKESEEAFDETFEQVKETLDAVGNCSTPANITGCPSFGVGKVEPSTPVAFDEDAFCRSEVEPGFEKYFSPVQVNGKLTCISPCEPAHPQPKGCQNDGTCEVLREGPTCYCRHTEQNWYLVSDCSYPVHKVGLCAGLGACECCTCAALLVTSVKLILTIMKRKREKDMKNELVNQWGEDDFEWPTSGRTSHSPSAGANANPAYQSGSLYTQQGLGLPGLQSRPAPGQMRARTDPHWASPQQVPSYRTDPHWTPLQQGPSYRSAPPAYTGPSPVSLQYQAPPQIPLHHLHSVQPMWDRMPQLRLSVRSFDI